MGLFTNRCVNPECDFRVRKGSRFCPGCGAGAPGGVGCCRHCGKEVGATSKFCWHCGGDLEESGLSKFTSNRWARGAADFAVRVDVEDIQTWLVKPLIIEHGTRALLFQSGRFRGELPEGRYDVGGFLSRISNFGVDRATSVVLMDAGDVSVDLENGKLWTADQLEINTSLRLVLRVEDPDAMFVNLIKGRGAAPLDVIECELADEAQMVLGGIIARYQSEQLFSSLDARYEIEDQLRKHLSTTLGRFGLSLIQLRFVDFSGEAFEALRQRRSENRVQGAEAELAEQRTLIAQRLRETLTRDRMHAFKDEKGFENFVRQTEHELGLKDVIRDDEMKRLKERFQFERDREQLLRRMELEGITNDGLREQAWKQLLADEQQHDERHRRELERQLATTQNEAEKRKIQLQIERLEHEEDVRQAEEGIRLLAKMHDEEQRVADAEQAREERRIKAFSQASAQALMAILDGPAADRVAKLEEFRLRQSMSPEQLLAVSASASPAAAQALGQKYAAEGQVSAALLQQLQKQLAEQRQMSEDYAARMERIMQTALQQMGGVATTRARPFELQQTVVVPGGLGAPVVISPPTTQPACPHCGAPMERAGNFCPACGKK